MPKEKKELVLIDGNYLMYRSFWGVRGLITSYGLAVNATFGFLVSLKKLLVDLQPAKIAVVFDSKGKTWRHELVEQAVKDGVTEKTYKDRTKVGLDNFYEQLNFTRKFLKALRIRTYKKPLTEADDIIGTLVKKYDAKGYRVILFTKDRDFYQLLKYNCALYKPDGIQRKYYDDLDFRNQYVITPSQWNAACSLTGDGSDTILGIRGIGVKKAGLLIREYGTLKNLIKDVKKNEHIHKYGASIRAEDIPRLKLNYKLKKLIDIPGLKPIPKMRKINGKLLKKMLKKYEMESLSAMQFRHAIEGNI